MNNLNHLGKGAVPRAHDHRNIIYSDLVAGAALLFDWSNKGFDLSDIIPFKVENQNGSSSCVGQAWSKYAEALNFIETKILTDLSARFIYSHIFLPNGGAYIYKGASLMLEKGVAKEATDPSYEGPKNDTPPSENFMRITDDSPTTLVEAAIYKSMSHAYVNNNIDEMALAIQKQNGMVIGINGSNAGASQPKGFLRPPLAGEEIWGHALYCVGAKLIDGKKYIKFINSWGSGWGDAGYGYLGEDYMPYTFNGITLVDLPNNWNSPMLYELWQVEGEKDIYIVRDGKKTLVYNLSAFSVVGDWSKIKKVTKDQLVVLSDSGIELAGIVNE